MQGIIGMVGKTRKNRIIMGNKDHTFGNEKLKESVKKIEIIGADQTLEFNYSNLLFISSHIVTF